MATIETPPVHRIAGTQLVALLILVAVALLSDKTEAYSVLVGGVVHIAPQAWFTRMAYRHTGARQAPKILIAIYQGEAGKLLLTATMFALIFFDIQPLHIPAVFLSYMAMVIVCGYSTAKVLNGQTNNKT